MMLTPLFSPDFTEQTDVLAGRLADSIQAYQHDLQTGLVFVDIPAQTGQILLFVRGQLVTVYRDDDLVERVDPATWLETLTGSNPRALMRMLALTPQDVRVFKILIEQKNDLRGVFASGPSLKKQFSEWMAHPVPALGRVRWPKAEALVLFPGQSGAPYYTLFITPTQILHSAGGVNEIHAWKEEKVSSILFSSEPRTFSIEIFPPKTEKGMESLQGALGELAKLKPDFVSVTYGAGGGSRDTTLGLVRLVQEQYGLTALHHFTCVIHTRSEIKAILDGTLGGVVSLATVTGAKPSHLEVGGVPLLAAEFSLEIYS